MYWFHKVNPNAKCLNKIKANRETENLAQTKIMTPIHRSYFNLTHILMHTFVFVPSAISNLFDPVDLVCKS